MTAEKPQQPGHTLCAAGFREQKLYTTLDTGQSWILAQVGLGKVTNYYLELPLLQTSVT